MKGIEEQLKAYKNETCVEQNPIEVNLVVERSKQVFFETVQKKPAAYFEFLYQQSKFIQKRWWLLQFFILLVLYGLLSTTQDGVMIQRGAGVLTPVFAVLLVPELWKNRNCESMEIEGTAYYSLRQIYAARLLLFAVVDGVFLSGFTVLAVTTTSAQGAQIVLQFFLPMIVTCIICFQMLCSRFVYSEYMAVFFSMIWIALWTLVVLRDEIYNAISVPMWVGICALAFFYLVYTIYKVMKESTNYWEVHRQWS